MNKFSIVALILMLGMTLSACGGGDSGGGSTPPPPVPSANADLEALTIGSVDLEQPFDPNQTFYTAIVGFLVVSVQIEASAEDNAATLTVNGEAIDSSGLTVSLGEGDNDVTVEVTAANGTSTRAYSITVTRQPAAAFAQDAYIKASNTEASDSFGSSIALSGDTLAVGAPGEDSTATGSNGDQSDNKGDGAGAVYVFKRGVGGVWSQQAYVKASNTELAETFGSRDAFGASVALSGETLVVGAPGEDSSSTGIDGDQGNNSATANSGAVYVFTRDAGGLWSQQAYVKASNTDAEDLFGHSVALAGDIMAVGAWREDSASTGVAGDQGNNDAQDSGAVYIFARDGARVWTQQAYIKASNTDASDFFGISVALSDDTLLVGASGEGSVATRIDGDQTNNDSPFSGAVYLFTRGDAGEWMQQIYVKASNPDSGDEFGYSVALSNGIFAVGAPDEDSAATGVNGDQGSNELRSAGAAYVFAKNTDGDWSQEAYLKASNGDDGDLFGSVVAISGEALVVGAVWERSAATGIDGDQDDNSASDAGAAYWFTRDSNGTWTQQNYIKGSNTSGEDGNRDEDGDYFGSAIAISEDTFVVGGFDDSNATGVNGDQVNENADRSGAVYSFGGPPNRISSLSSLDVGGIDLDQIFQPSQFNYTAGAGFLSSSVRLTAETEGSGAAVFVNGTRLVPEGVNLSLEEGSNSVEIEVVASDGTTTSFYTLTIIGESAAQFAQTAYVKASNTGSADNFGYSVAIDGNTLAIGAPFEDSASVLINGDQIDNRSTDKGAVYVFQRESNTTWTQTAYIKTGGIGGGAHFGHSVSLSDNTLAVGAPHGFPRISGSVFIFEPNDSGFWQQRAHIKADNGDDFDAFGYSVSLSGNTLAVGAIGEDSESYRDNNNVPDSGAAYVFVRNVAGAWEQQARIKASNADTGDRFGFAVALSGELLAVSAPDERSAATGIGGDENDNSAEFAGATYMFARTREGNWLQEGYIKASNTEAEDKFGQSVALSGNTLAVGAIREDSAFSGVNTEQGDNKARDAGAVYVFVRLGAGLSPAVAGWSQQAYIKASNTDAWDLFGYAVALDGDTLAVGARDEKSIATGINGDQFNDLAEFSGAAYVFTRDASGLWSQRAYIKASNAEVRDNFANSISLSDGVLAVGAHDEDSAVTGIEGDQSDNSAVYSGAVYEFQ